MFSADHIVQTFSVATNQITMALLLRTLKMLQEALEADNSFMGYMKDERGAVTGDHITKVQCVQDAVRKLEKAKTVLECLCPNNKGEDSGATEPDPHEFLLAIREASRRRGPGGKDTG